MHTNTHTDITDKSHFKKPGVHRATPDLKNSNSYDNYDKGNVCKIKQTEWVGENWLQMSIRGNAYTLSMILVTVLKTSGSLANGTFRL